MLKGFESVICFLQDARRISGLSYRRWGKRFGISRQRMHKIVGHGVVGREAVQRILEDMAGGPDNPFPDSIREQAASVLSRLDDQQRQ